MKNQLIKPISSNVILLVAAGLPLLNLIISLEGILYVIIILLYIYIYLKERENKNALQNQTKTKRKK